MPNNTSETLYSCGQCSTKTNGKKARKVLKLESSPSDQKLLEVHRLMCTKNNRKSPISVESPSLKRKAKNQPLITCFFKKVKTSRSRTLSIPPIIDLVSF